MLTPWYVQLHSSVCFVFLQGYLDSKRALWPRLFLLDNRRLLRVLGAQTVADLDPVLPFLFASMYSSAEPRLSSV